jgi:hypothetical protein
VEVEVKVVVLVEVEVKVENELTCGSGSGSLGQGSGIVSIETDFLMPSPAGGGGLLLSTRRMIGELAAWGAHVYTLTQFCAVFPRLQNTG